MMANVSRFANAKLSRRRLIIPNRQVDYEIGNISESCYGGIGEGLSIQRGQKICRN
jgi:hypothetical protein